MKEFDLPFGEQAPAPLELDDAILVDQIVVMGAVLPVEASVPGANAQGKLPVLVFRFSASDGSAPLPPIALVLTEKHMVAVPKLVADAVTAVLKATQA